MAEATASNGVKRPNEMKEEEGANKRRQLTHSKEEFMSAYEELANVCIDEISQYNDLPQAAIDWVKEMLDYNVPGGKLNRGLSVVDTYALVLGRPLTEEEKKRAMVLGWCVEWLQAFFLVADDVMDGSKTRRGQPCWFRKEKVGLIAINDSFILSSCVNILLKRYFEKDACYIQLYELFREVTLLTELGQQLDLTTQPADAPLNLKDFTSERHSGIVKYKTAFYSFYLPVALALVLAGVFDEATDKEAKDILIPMGEYFQIQDDYLDCYGDPKVIGKVGTDIQDKKCSWLVVQALKLATPEQRKVIEENYGVDDEAKIKRIKDLYKEMKLEEKYLQYEEETYQALKKQIAETSGKCPAAVFDAFLAKIFKRQH